MEGGEKEVSLVSLNCPLFLPFSTFFLPPTLLQSCFSPFGWYLLTKRKFLKSVQSRLIQTQILLFGGKGFAESSIHLRNWACFWRLSINCVDLQSYPLFDGKRNRAAQFNYGVFLLNRNLAQIRHHLDNLFTYRPMVDDEKAEAEEKRQHRQQHCNKFF